MNSVPASVGGHSAYGSAGLQLIASSKTQIEEVAQFRARARDFSAPRMQLASSLPAAPLKDMETRFDLRA
ncbi:MAG: hypothetical protein O3B73_10685 [bacterium]|jgi:hypothetical protein|nr:hypothetical protein [bacterium]